VLDFFDMRRTVLILHLLFSTTVQTWAQNPAAGDWSSYARFSDGYVVAYDIGSGDQVWATRLAETDGRPATIAASPVAWNGMVFIRTSGAERACGCIVAG